jgi:hypothetical protein
MRAVAILVNDLKLHFQAAKTFDAKIQRRPLSEKEVNYTCEQLLFALHQFTSLQAILESRTRPTVPGSGSSHDTTVCMAQLPRR